MASQLQEILRTLCDGTEWCYAIFWRLKDEMLERKEGYCRPRDLTPCELSPEAQASDTCIERALDKAAYHIHNTRNGIIEHVALSNIHLWIFNSRADGHLSELYEQFAAGIQTVAVISVHQGVVQLGSMNVTAEDSSFIAYVKSLFSKEMRAQEGIVGALTAKSAIEVNHTKISQTMLSDATTEGFTEMSDAWTAGALAEQKPGVGIILQELLLSELSPSDEQQAEHLLNSIVRPQDFLPDYELGANVQSMQSQSFVAHGQTSANSTDRAHNFFSRTTVDCSIINVASTALAASGEILYKSRTELCRKLVAPMEAALGIAGNTQACKGALDTVIHSQAHAKGTLLTNPPSSLHHSSVLENSILLFSKAGSLSGFSSDTASSEYPRIFDFHTSDINSYECGIEEMAFISPIPCSQDQKFSCLFSSHDTHDVNSSTLRSSFNDFLQRLSGIELDEFDKFIASVSKEEAIDVKNKQMRCHNSNPMHCQEAGDSQIIVNATSEHHLPSFWDHGCLQHDLPWNLAANQGPEEGMTASCLTDETETFQMGTSYSIKTGQRNDLQVTGHEGPAKDIESLVANTKHGGAHHKIPQTLITPQKGRTLQGDLSADEPPPTSRTNKKRTRQGGKPIKRPKDRQRIQDCLYELRSIIPSSGKCSIDALLEKTIKYMSFLQSMAEDDGIFSDDNGNSEVQGNEAGQSSRSSNQKAGASWALELSGYGGFCPVLVEDLKGPQQMSVQMLCEEEGLFLEIAQTLRGLGLKILKGEVESKDKKMWARLVVEGNGHVQRLHITWSLMQLLESSARCGASATISQAVCVDEQRILT